MGYFRERQWEQVASSPGARAAAYAKEARDARLLARSAGLEPAGRVAAVAPHLTETDRQTDRRDVHMHQ